MNFKLSVRRIVQGALLLYVCFCLALWGFQRRLIYNPDTTIQSLHAYGLQEFKELRLHAEDKTELQAWYHPAKNGFPTILLFHGKTGNLGRISDFLKALTQKGFGLVALSYRGFGASQGSPSEEGLYQDARAAIHYALHDLKLANDKIILYGQSLGTGVATQMATEFQMAAVVLQSPYTSITRRGEDLYPLFPINFLLCDRFDSLSKIQNIQSPLLILHGEEDTIVPVQDGRELFAAAPNPKVVVYFPLKNHNDIGNDNLLRELVVFVKKFKLISLV